AAAMLSLPGIFMSCVQCFELIQTGRNFDRDLIILTTKFSNQQLRFTKWGKACGFKSPDRYSPSLDRAELRPNIEKTFRKIQLILQSGQSVLCAYETLFTSENTTLLDQTASIRWSWKVLKGRLGKIRKTEGTRKATKWALADKKKLDELVRHLSGLINDLESVTKDLGIVQRQRILIQYEIQSISDKETLDLM
ncbi:hypothetical protein BS50DRAFT_449903, partial [Corynespora cassiicola Philippines]